MTQLTTNELRVMALILDVHPDLLKTTDNDELLFVVQHQLMHSHMQGKFKAFYDSLPSDIGRHFLLDQRTAQWLIKNAAYFWDEPKKPTLADRLETSVKSDVWDDTVLDITVRKIQSDMLEAAGLLRKHGLDK
jgi:hypothetical protein